MARIARIPQHRIKIVMDSTPDADGEWIGLPADFAKDWPAVHGWNHLTELLKDHIPAGTHLVAFERMPSEE